MVTATSTPAQQRKVRTQAFVQANLVHSHALLLEIERRNPEGGVGAIVHCTLLSGLSMAFLLKVLSALLPSEWTRL